MESLDLDLVLHLVIAEKALSIYVESPNLQRTFKAAAFVSSGILQLSISQRTTFSAPCLAALTKDSCMILLGTSKTNCSTMSNFPVNAAI